LFDYCKLLYTEGGLEVFYPGKIACFYECPVENGRLKMLIQEVYKVTNDDIGDTTKSMIFKEYRLQNKLNTATGVYWPKLQLMDLGCICDSVYVIEQNAKSGQFERTDVDEYDILEVRYLKEEWPISFLNLCTYVNG
jgi:hypothetical protein